MSEYPGYNFNQLTPEEEQLQREREELLRNQENLDKEAEKLKKQAEKAEREAKRAEKKAQEIEKRERKERERDDRDRAAEEARRKIQEELGTLTPSEASEEILHTSEPLVEDSGEIVLPSINEVSLRPNSSEVMFDRDKEENHSRSVDNLKEEVAEIKEVAAEAQDAYEEARTVIDEVFETQEIADEFMPKPEIPRNEKGRFMQSLSALFRRSREKGYAESADDIMSHLEENPQPGTDEIEPLQTFGRGSSETDWTPLEGQEQIPIPQSEQADETEETLSQTKKTRTPWASLNPFTGALAGFSFGRTSKKESVTPRLDELKHKLDVLEEKLRTDTTEVKRDTADIRSQVEKVQGHSDIFPVYEELRTEQNRPLSRSETVGVTKESDDKHEASQPLWVERIQDALRNGKPLPEITNAQRDIIRRIYPDTWEKLSRLEQNVETTPEVLPSQRQIPHITPVQSQYQAVQISDSPTVLPAPQPDATIAPMMHQTYTENQQDMIALPPVRVVVAVVTALLLTAALFGILSA